MAKRPLLRGWGATRAGARRAQASSDGKLTLLYDEANASRIKTSGLVASNWGRLQLGRLAHRRLLVAYACANDGGPVAEVVVGPGLTAAERRALPWSTAAHAALELPSGRLRVDSVESVLFGDGTPDEKGTRLTLPAGDYKVAVHRLDVERLDGARYDGPTELICLSPATQATRRAASPILFEAVRSPKHPTPARIDSGRFETMLRLEYYWDFVLALTPKDLAGMGLRPDTWLRLTVPELDGLRIDLLYLHEFRGVTYTRKGRQRLPAEFALGAMVTNALGKRVFACERFNGRIIEPRHHHKWLVVHGEIVPPRSTGPIRCPRCGWEPRPDDGWQCECGRRHWNLFATDGVCPACGQDERLSAAGTQCQLCGQRSPFKSWSAKPSRPTASAPSRRSSSPRTGPP